MFTKIKMTVPFDLTKPTIGPILGGQPNPFYPLVLFMNDNTPKNQKPDLTGKTLDRYTMDGQNYIYQAEIDPELFDLQVCALVVQQGGEVERYPLWAKVDPDALKPGDEEERTWAEFVESQAHQKPTTVRTETGVDWYMAVKGGDNQYLPVSQAIGMFGLESIRTQPQINDLVANQVPEPTPDPGDPE